MSEHNTDANIIAARDQAGIAADIWEGKRGVVCIRKDCIWIMWWWFSKIARFPHDDTKRIQTIVEEIMLTNSADRYEQSYISIYPKILVKKSLDSVRRSFIQILMKMLDVYRLSSYVGAPELFFAGKWWLSIACLKYFGLIEPRRASPCEKKGMTTFTSETTICNRSEVRMLGF